jgi:HEAT repeat protein/MFS family permease
VSAEPQPLNRHEVLRGIRMANLDAGLYTAFIAFSTGAFVIGFARHLGLNDFWLGVLISMPALVGLFHVPGSIWADMFPSRRTLCVPMALAHRVFWACIAVLPFLPAHYPRGAMLMFFMTLAALSVTLINSTFLAWLGDLVSEKHRGWFFGRRTAVCGWVAVLVSIPAGLLVDTVIREKGPSIGYGVTFGIGTVASLMSFYFFARIPEPPRATKVKRTLREATESVRSAFLDRNYRSVILFSLAFAFAVGFPSAFFADYMLKQLKMSFTMIQVIGTVTSLSSISSTKLWGFLSDRFGSKPILIISCAGITPLLLFWVACSPDHLQLSYIYLFIAHVLGGVFWAGVGIAHTKLMIEAAPKEHQTVAVGAVSTVNALAMGIAPALAGALMQSMKGVFADEFRYETIFLITVVMRTAVFFSAFLISDPRATRVREVMSQLGAVRPSGMLALRKLGTRHDKQSREAAIEQLGQVKMGMAVEELAVALDDPEPSVRKKALAALSQIGGTKASELILQHMREHPEYADEDAVSALADIGTEEGVQSIARLLSSPSPGLRLAAARALGRAGGPIAVQALSEVADSTEDPDLRRTALRALGNTQSPEGYAAIQRGLEASEASIRLVAAEAVATLNIRAAADTLRRRLLDEEGSVAAEMAYALGVVGDTSDFDTIGDVVARMEPGMARQRAVLGWAKLLGVERELYKLLVLRGMDRDAAVLQALRAKRRHEPAYRLAAHRYAQGDEGGALRALAEASDANPWIRRLLRSETTESFLLAVGLLEREGRSGTHLAGSTADQ